MARAPFAEWRGPLPAANYAPGQMGAVIGVTVHHMDGSLASADGWFHNPKAGSSAHFGIGYDGTTYQWVDTNDAAYHACRANWTGWVGIENESDPNNPDAPPTAAQIAAMGKIIAWLNVQPVPATDPLGGGVGYHRQFPGACNAAWGQTACPGQGFVDAIPAICRAAGSASPPPSFTEGSSRMIAVCHIQGHTDLFTVTSDNKVWWKHDGNAPTVLTVNGNAKNPEITKDGDEAIFFRGPDKANGEPQYVKGSNGPYGWTAVYV